MKKTINKIKAALAILWLIVTSFSEKIFGQFGQRAHVAQPMYGIELPESSEYSPINAIKMAQFLLIAVIFIVGIVSFLKIRKIDDKTLKIKRIRNTIIIITILVLILIASFVIPARLLTR